jgi:hypothetical protein
MKSPSGYKNRARDPSAPSYLDAEHWNQPEKLFLRAPPWPPAIPSRAPPFASSSASFLREVRSHCLVLHPGTFISSNDARFRVLANSSDGAAAELVASVFFRSDRRPARLDPIWAIYFESNGWYWKIPVWMHILLKRPCVFQLINPQSKAYFRIA